MDKNHFLSADGIITNEGNEVLLIKHLQHDLEFPGDMIELGENI